MCGSWSQLGPHAPPLRSSGRGCKMKDKASTARPSRAERATRAVKVMLAHSRPLLMLLMEFVGCKVQHRMYRDGPSSTAIQSTWRPSRGGALAAVARMLRLPAVQVPRAPAWTKHTHYGGTGIHYGARLLLWAATQSMESKRLVEWVAVPHGPFITGACQVLVT